MLQRILTFIQVCVVGSALLPAMNLEHRVCVQVDLDLGNYERFLDIKLQRDNNIMTGKIYQV